MNFLHDSRRFLRSVAVSALILPFSTASAALLLDPVGGVIRASGSTGPADKDEGTFGTYPFITPYFGSEPTAGPTITLNGFIRFGDADGPTADYNLQPLGMSGASRIAPLWVDLELGASGQVLEHVGAGESYYAVTWRNMVSVDHPGNLATFQAIFFEGATTLHGIQFNAGDIAFSYGDMSMFPDLNEAVIGVESGGSFATIGLLEDTHGVVIPGELGHGDFPVGANEYIHFRADGSGNYDVTIAPIPEPSSALLAAAGACIAMVRGRRRP
ncbi:hypothetical protein OVA24_08910 [Luteolibacter sp. SL250]|uniref:hypothetical protein n=1 Tax=Luteolibacter sp. SL250 TaxID=2995170 RepID=UPI00226E3CA5|nr:hypothetical protein [Luteolibacter sp. SL250]WAC21503.1 hypothetical protein OVA24_08910 [Luteolibacter sp. SL250]